MARDAGETLPSGTLTFLFTDVEGSTRLWEEQPDEMSRSLRRHDAIIAEEVVRAGGTLVKTKGEGDSAFAVFERVSTGIEAALGAQRRLASESWDTSSLLHVRMALHTGEAELRDGDYYGTDVNRCARLRAIAFGRQVLVSESAATLARDVLPADASLLDLGSHRLKDLSTPERVFQLAHPDLATDFPPLLSLDARPHNLPVELTSFVGRENEIAEVEALVSSHRLVTLLGPGGTGKTRLALQVAAEMIEKLPEGAWVVQLAPVSDPDLVAQTVVNDLRLPEEPARTAIETITTRLRDRSMLLVLDNCEQVRDAVRALVESVLETCPDVRIVTTSRERLGTRGEADYPVQPISIADAVELFAERARLVKPDFHISEDNLGAIEEICRRVDSLPLSIELAASRVRALPPRDILDRLSDSFRLLRGTDRARIGRHESLGAAIDWSYSLLDATEQTVFRRLAVCVGGFAIPAAEAVCSGDDIKSADVFDVLSRLVDKSMVVAGEGVDGSARYRLLETMREYGLALLTETSENVAVRDRHLDYYGRWAEEVSRGLDGRDYFSSIDRVQEEIGNIRAAMTFATEAQRPDDVIEMVGALGPYWEARALPEGHAWLQRVWTEEPAHTRQSMRAAAWGAQNALFAGDHDKAVLLADSALDIARGLGNPRWLVDVLGTTSEIRMSLDDPTARELAEESLAIARSLEDPGRVSRALYTMARVELSLEDYERAREFADENLELARSHGSDRDVSVALLALTRALIELGDDTRVHNAVAEQLEFVLRSGDPTGLATVLEFYAHLAARSGRSDEAVRITAAARRLWDEALVMIPPMARRRVGRWLEPIRAELDTETFERLWEDGYAMTKEQAVAYATNEKAETRPRGTLTNRELEVAGLLADGLTNRQIADRLVLSERTVDSHVDHIRNKLGLRTRAQIASWVTESRLSGSR